MLALLQKLAVLSIFMTAGLWYGIWANVSMGLAVLGALMTLLSFITGQFLLGMAAARQTSSISATPEAQRPTPWQRLRAGWLEVCIFPSIFAWRQPFFSEEVLDHLTQSTVNPELRGFVFIHGFVSNRGFWTPWLKLAQKQGHAFVAVNLEPVVGDIDDYAPTIEAAVQQVTQRTKKAPVLVCHSMGGLAVRAWWRATADDLRVHHIITIASPHHGTWLGGKWTIWMIKLMPWFTSAKQSQGLAKEGVCLPNEWLQKLASQETVQRRQRMTCFYGDCDSVSFPAMIGGLPEAENILIKGRGHLCLAFHDKVIETAFDWVRG